MLRITIIEKVLFQNLYNLSPTNAKLKFFVFFLIPLTQSLTFLYIDLSFPKMYFHDYYVLRIQQYCMYEFSVVHILFIFVYLLYVIPNKTKKKRM